MISIKKIDFVYKIEFLRYHLSRDKKRFVGKYDYFKSSNILKARTSTVIDNGQITYQHRVNTIRII